MPYLTPSFDMWRFGCTMFEAATNTKLFTKRRKDRVLLHRDDPGFGDQHYFLDSMVEVLGFAPRGVSGQRSAQQAGGGCWCGAAASCAPSCFCVAAAVASICFAAADTSVADVGTECGCHMNVHIT